MTLSKEQRRKPKCSCLCNVDEPQWHSNDCDIYKAWKAQPNLPCPFCGGDVDPKGWLAGDGERGPECEGCGATARSIKDWNKRAASKSR